MDRPKFRGTSATEWPKATLLGRLKPATRNAILSLGTTVSYPADRVIIRQGDQDRHVHLLLSGLVKVTTIEADQEAFLAIRVAGDIVGEMAALEPRPRSASVATATETTSRIISPYELKMFVEKHPDAAIQLMRMMSERLRWSNSRRVDIATRSAPARICRILLEIAHVYGHGEGDGSNLGVPLTQPELASLAGLALRTTEKVLYDLDKQGMINRGYRQMIITDMGKLQEVAEPTIEIPH